jgi:hypothetical protein
MDQATCCGQAECECGDHELVPKISYSTWGEYYMSGVYDRYFDFEAQGVWRGSRGPLAQPAEPVRALAATDREAVLADLHY